MSHRHPTQKSAHPSLVSCTALGNTPIFSRPEVAQKVIDLWRAEQEAKRLAVYAYVLIEDHLSVILSADELDKQWARFRAASAQQVLELLDAIDARDLARRVRRFQDAGNVDPAARLWQNGGAPKPLLGHAAMQAEVEQIHAQPVRRGYVSDAMLYRYSSARNYAGQPGLLPVWTEW